MPIFGISEASHFCANYSAGAGVAAGSFRQQYGSLGVGRKFSEGTPAFAELRDCAVREVERLLFLGISNYRRSFDLLTPAASSWAHVTMYYAAYYCATSLLGMFGAWKLRGSGILDVSSGVPGTQFLETRTLSSSYHGSHQKFWDFFYINAAPLAPWVDPSLRFALAPFSSTVTWLIDHRNDINYDSHSACGLLATFQSSFRRSRFPSSLPGALNTQFRLTQALVAITTRFAKDLGVSTDALSLLQPAGRRKLKVRDVVLDACTPNLRRCIRRRMLLT